MSPEQPLSCPDPQTLYPSQPADDHSSHAEKTILIADDSLTVRRLNERALRRAGYNVVLAEDGRQAVNQALEHHPDLIVLDINMPELDGYGVCHELLAKPEWDGDTPVVFLTCAEEPHIAALGQELGAFLPKPTQAEQLIETIESLLHVASQERGT